MEKRFVVRLVLGVFLIFFLGSNLRGEDFGVFKEGKGVVLKVEGQGFGIGAGKPAGWSWDWLSVDNVISIPHTRAICTTLRSPDYKGMCTFPASNIEEIKMVLDKEDEKVVYLKINAYAQEEKKLASPYYLEVNLRIKKGFPCLFIYQRIPNFTESPKQFVSGSYARDFSVYADSDSNIIPVPKAWTTLKKDANWFWAKREITDKTEGEKGLGIISFTPTNFNSEPSGHINWGYNTKAVEEGETLEYKWVVTAAENPEEVNTLYQKVKDIKLDLFLSPEESAKSITSLNKKEEVVENVTSFNELVIDLIKLAFYADWNNYYGGIKFGHYQDKVNCALYNNVKGKTTLLMTPQWKEGYVRGKYHIYLPKSDSVLFKSDLFPEERSVEAEVSVGYYLEGKGTTYLIKDQRSKSLECALTDISGQECDLLLRAKGLSVGGSFQNWDNARIIINYPEKGLPDLSISPSDIEITPLPDTRVNIKTTIRNIGKVKADEFIVKLYNGDNIVGEKRVNTVSGKEAVILDWGFFEKIDGKIIVEIVSNFNENSKDNNKGILFCKSPTIYGVHLKDIEGYPAAWKVEEVKVNIINNLRDTTDYKLICSVSDYWEKEIKKIEQDIPKDTDTIILKPFIDKKVGWWKMDVSIVHKNKEIDSLETSFCKVPLPPAKAQRDSIFGIFHTCWRTPEMIKDTGASYASGLWQYDPLNQPRRDESAILYIEDYLKQGQNPYVAVLQEIIPSPTMPLSKCVEEARNFGYKVASKYKHKETGIWWYIQGELNPRISPHDYAEIVKGFYEGAIKVDPDVKIATMEMTHGSPSLLDSGKKGTQYEWFAEMYPQARKYIHAAGNNHYSHLAPEEPFYNQTVKPLIDVIEKYGDLGKMPVHLQEGNISSSHGTGTVAASLVRMYLYQLGLKERGASHIEWFCIQDYWTPITMARQGLCEFNSHPRPEYQAYAVMTQELTGAEFIEKKDIGKDSYFYVFRKGKDLIVCLWKGKKEKEIICFPAESQVEITNLMGEKQVIKPTKGEVKIVISADPVYVRGLNLKDFKVISRYPYTEGSSFEKEFPTSKELLTKKTIVSGIYYNIAKKKWELGSSGIEQLIQEGLKAVSSEGLSAQDTVIAKYISTPITLDGDLSEWDLIPSYNVSDLNPWSGSGKYNGEKDLSYTFQVCWDKDNLYFAFRVKDDIVISEYPSTGIGGYGGDCVEIYLDVLNKKSTSPDIEFSQHYFGLNNKIGRLGGYDGIHPKMIWKKTTDGYNMEILYPLKEIFLEDLSSGYRIAFNVHIDDSDEVENVKGALSWKQILVAHTACGAGEILFMK